MHRTAASQFLGLRALRVSVRFGGPPTWLDAYGATAPAEFFAVACEGYFVNRERFTQDFSSLTVLFDQFFKANQALAQ